MRTLKIKLFLLILIIYSSCSTRKLNKQKSESSASAQSEIRKQEDHRARYDAKLIRRISDSTHELYTIRIIPADTFTFSVQNGFRGKAEKIEISGLRSKMKILSDSTGIQAELQSSRIQEENQQSETYKSTKTKVWEKKSLRLTVFLMGLFGIILLIWWLNRNSRNF